ncbi:glycolate oxidase subunit GlcE [Ramlibacter sp. XY19]|uniref:glycolate oxidase subunit GlcE n=1 Tax=Ramlibacter paludis TaxID=2908000 RepID=UPI0023DA9BF8|nr:glycolate oxidase subunit GlcE [Ramlibacter paludis]MCG2594485.1 glycolate oxidase subunit GlcE [Ramlibacter paludis]
MDPALARLVDRVRAASAAGTPLAIRGGGTKDFYGKPAGGEPLATGELRGIVSYEPSELVVTVRAGTPLAELEELLAERGQCLPFEPPHFGPGATVGGMVASGLSGPARASVGSVRDYVLGLQLVNGRAEQLVFGGQVMKNVAGYDVSRLMVGALGTLGLITEVSLKVLPRAPAEATLRFAMPQDLALRQLNAWGGQPLPLNASLWLPDGGGTLFLRLRGAVAAVDAACRSLGGERTTDFDWDACREQRLPWFEGARDLWRLSVPQTAPVLDLPQPPLVEWHGAQRWVRAPASEGAALRALAAKAGGHATLFRAADAASTGRQAPLAPALLAIQRELKRQFDPAGIFNRGRLFPEA